MKLIMSIKQQCDEMYCWATTIHVVKNLQNYEKSISAKWELSKTNKYSKGTLCIRLWGDNQPRETDQKARRRKKNPQVCTVNCYTIV